MQSNPKTKTQLAAEYGISRPTFYQWLKRVGLCFSSRSLLTPKEIETIYEALGKPGSIDQDDKSRAR